MAGKYWRVSRVTMTLRKIFASHPLFMHKSAISRYPVQGLNLLVWGPRAGMLSTKWGDPTVLR